MGLDLCRRPIVLSLLFFLNIILCIFFCKFKWWRENDCTCYWAPTTICHQFKNFNYLGFIAGCCIATLLEFTTEMD